MPTPDPACTPQVHETERIWIVRQWFLRHDGWDHAEIVFSHEPEAGLAAEGWTVTEYRRVPPDGP